MKKAVSLILCILLFPMSLSACSASERLTEAIYTTTLDSDNITLGGAPLLIPAYGEMYIIPTTNITYLTLAGVWYKLALEATAGEQHGFTSDNTGRMTYNDITPNRICLVIGAFSLRSDTADVIVSIKLYVNGLPSESSLIKISLLEINAPRVVTLTALVELQPADYMEIWVSSTTAGIKVNTNGFNFTATTVD